MRYTQGGVVRSAEHGFGEVQVTIMLYKLGCLEAQAASVDHEKLLRRTAFLGIFVCVIAYVYVRAFSCTLKQFTNLLLLTL